MNKEVKKGMQVKMRGSECSACKSKLSTVFIGADGKRYCEKCLKEKGLKELAVFDIGFRTVDSYNK